MVKKKSTAAASPIIQVTRENFSRLLPTILTCIDTCHFYTLDTELTGLTMSKAHRYSAFDDMQSRYNKLRESANGFALLQVGLGCFTWMEGKQKWAHACYSFNVFQDVSLLGFAQERRFACQVSSLQFLAQNGFDFNRCFRDGIAYMSAHDERIYRENNGLVEGREEERKSKHALIELKDQDKEFMEGIFGLIEEWLAAGDTPSLCMPHCNSYQRLLIHQQMDLKYKQLYVEKKNVGGKVQLTLLKEFNKDEEEKKRREDRVNALEGCIGFRRVWDRLVASRKPLVAHNCMLDFCHLFGKLAEPLPHEYSEFKRKLNALFPTIYDTKYLCLTVEAVKELQSTSLSDLFSYYKQTGVVAKAIEDGQFHDAGFDAYCTGHIFAAYLHAQHEGNLELSSDLANRLNVMQSPYEYAYLAGTDPEPDWSKIIVLSINTERLSSEQVSNKDVRNLIEAKGWKCTYAWNNEVSLFLSFESAEGAAGAMEEHNREENRLFEVTPLNDFHRNNMQQLKDELERTPKRSKTE